MTQFITNFSKWELPRYERACAVFNALHPKGPRYFVDGPNMERFDEGGEEFNPDPNDMGLFVEGKRGDTTKWRTIFNALEPKREYFFKLKQIKRLRLPNLQTVLFVESVDSWMAKWTIDNFVEPIIVTDQEEAFKYWANAFDRAFISAFGRQMLPSLLDLRHHFEFVYTKTEVRRNEPFYLNSGSWTVQGADIGIKENANG